MSSDLEVLKRSSVSVLLKLALTGVGLAMIWLDIAVFNTQMLEISFTEITQEIMLFLCAVLFWWCSRVAGQKGFSVLAGGFFACLLMRELDGLFDPISHSAWCWPFTVIAIVSLFVGFRPKNRDETLAALARFARTPAFGSITTGLGVLVFSRVFGMGNLWHLILNEGYARLAKTTVEEGVELLTYAMWLAASIDHFWSLRPVTHAVKKQTGSHSFAPNRVR
ncbi:MAG TPA: hypothetical protein VGC62_06830 [Pseudomonas sp.]|uniref:hypothetical protein n=1 Tax=Pseudomonas sp. TaxID=306 RepID=UPI002EDABD0A